MKKLLVIPFLALVCFGACRKKENSVSTLVTYSTPIISVTSGNFYSIPVGGSVPAITATAYDTFYKESYPVQIDQSTLDNTEPGFNIVTVRSKNKYGMEGTARVYVVVTDADPSLNLAGTYMSSLGGASTLTKLATGFYRTDNVGGVMPTDANFIGAYIIQTSTGTITVPYQNTAFGPLSSIADSLSLAPADTFYQYAISGNSSFSNDTVRFQRQ